MSKLDDFLGLVDVTEMRETIPVEVGDKKFEFVIRPITDAEHSEFQKRSNIMVKNKISFDASKYVNLLLEACIVEPNFRDTEFLNKVKCTTAGEFLRKKFPAGTLSDIAVKIQKLSGFDAFELEVEDAKN